MLFCQSFRTILFQKFLMMWWLAIIEVFFQKWLARVGKKLSVKNYLFKKSLYTFCINAFAIRSCDVFDFPSSNTVLLPALSKSRRLLSVTKPIPSLYVKNAQDLLVESKTFLLKRKGLSGK